MLDLYSEKGKYKLIALLIASLIVSASVYYTNYVISNIAYREEEQIKQYAKELQFLLETSENQDNSRLDKFITDMLESNKDIPLILTDEKQNIIDSKNISLPRDTSQRKSLLAEEFEQMKEEHQPIVVEDQKSGVGRTFIYFHNSHILEQLRFFPYVQLTIIFVFAFMAFLAFSYSKRAEQNRVWIGLAKETAHQLGTPLSSLMAWTEYLRADERFENEEFVPELEKDVLRLQQVTERFSQIGSVPAFKNEDVFETVELVLNYLRKRISTKVKIKLENLTERPPIVLLNRQLFEWVIENICKNAVDAMSGIGELTVRVMSIKGGKIAIDITDTGKGIAKGNLQAVFEPGFSTKKRGWGLGLTLAKRIVENYHKGKVFVKHSELGKGTTFRIILERQNVVNPVITSQVLEKV